MKDARAIIMIATKRRQATTSQLIKYYFEV